MQDGMVATVQLSLLLMGNFSRRSLDALLLKDRSDMRSNDVEDEKNLDLTLQAPSSNCCKLLLVRLAYFFGGGVLVLC